LIGIDKPDRIEVAPEEEVDLGTIDNKQDLKMIEQEILNEPEWEEVFNELIFGKKDVPCHKRFCCTKPDEKASCSEKFVRKVFCCSCASKRDKAMASSPLELARQRIYTRGITNSRAVKSKI